MAQKKTNAVFDAGRTSPDAIGYDSTAGRDELLRAQQFQAEANTRFRSTVADQVIKGYRGYRQASFERDVVDTINRLAITDVNTGKIAIASDETKDLVQAIQAKGADTLGAVRAAGGENQEPDATGALQTQLNESQRAALSKFAQESDDLKEAWEQRIFTADEFRTRMNVLLKKHIAGAPGWAADYRAIAQELTGVGDWDSWSVRAALEQQQVAKAAKAEENKFAFDSVKFAVDNGFLLDTKGTETLSPDELYGLYVNGDKEARARVDNFNANIRREESLVKRTETQVKAVEGNQKLATQTFGMDLTGYQVHAQNKLIYDLHTKINADKRIQELLANPTRAGAAELEGYLTTQMTAIFENARKDFEATANNLASRYKVNIFGGVGAESYNGALKTFDQWKSMATDSSAALAIAKMVGKYAEASAEDMKLRFDTIAALTRQLPGASTLYQEWLADPEAFESRGNTDAARGQYAVVGDAFRRLQVLISQGSVDAIGGVPVAYKDAVNNVLAGRETPDGDLADATGKLCTAIEGCKALVDAGKGQKTDFNNKDTAFMVKFVKDAANPAVNAYTVLEKNAAYLDKAFTAMGPENASIVASTFVGTTGKATITPSKTGYISRMTDLLAHKDYDHLEVVYDDKTNGLKLQIKPTVDKRSLRVGGFLPGQKASPVAAQQQIDKFNSIIRIASSPSMQANSQFKVTPKEWFQGIADAVNFNVPARVKDKNAPLQVPEVLVQAFAGELPRGPELPNNDVPVHAGGTVRAVGDAPPLTWTYGPTSDEEQAANAIDNTYSTDKISGLVDAANTSKALEKVDKKPNEVVKGLATPADVKKALKEGKISKKDAETVLLDMEIDRIRKELGD